jgi:hypothetical protein
MITGVVAARGDFLIAVLFNIRHRRRTAMATSSMAAKPRVAAILFPLLGDLGEPTEAPRVERERGRRFHNVRYSRTGN